VAYVEGEGADPVKHRLDVFRPEGRTGLPVLIFFHGGVWQRGDRSAYASVGEAFARRGIVTLVVSYRLTPAVRHPGHVRDAARAVAWASANAERFGGRKDRLFLSGHSAGGHLVTLLLFEPTWLKEVGLTPGALAGVIPLSGVFDLTKPIDDTKEGGFASFIYPPFDRGVKARRAASPITHVHAVRTPLLLLLAGEDYEDMRVQSKDFAAALRAHQVPMDFVTVPGRGPAARHRGRPGHGTDGALHPGPSAREVTRPGRRDQRARVPGHLPRGYSRGPHVPLRLRPGLLSRRCRHGRAAVAALPAHV
jgi:acetyl esterase/lipase